MKITVFTPTYNRAALLPRLYESIKQQDFESLEWLIIDDGSTDGTAGVVEQFNLENKVNIKYIAQENLGKHVAFNRAVELAEGEYFFCVDSDDFLADSAVNTIVNELDDLPDDVCGLLAKKCDTNGNALCCAMPDGVEYETAYNLNKVYNCTGEFSLVYKTSVLSQFRFPEIKSEKFVTESVLYDMLDEKHRYKLSDEVLTICEYQEGGLSAAPYRVMLSNPTGYKAYYCRRIDMARSFSERLGYIIRYNAFRSISNSKDFEYNSTHKVIVKLLTPAGYLLRGYYEYKGRLKD